MSTSLANVGGAPGAADTTGLDFAAAEGMRRRRRGGRPPWQEPPGPIGRIGKAVLLIVLAAVVLFPFLYVVSVSLSTYADIAGGGVVLFPRNPTLDAYHAVLSGGIVVQALRVSIGLTLLGTLLNVAMTTALAYGLSRPGVVGRRVVLWLVLFTLLFGPGMIPNYLLVKELGLLNTYGALVLPGAINAFNLIVLRNFFMNIPQDLLDSARVDGASDWQLLWNIVLPLSKAALAVVALFYGVAHWNDFFAATLYIQDTAMWPIQLVLRQYVLQGSALASAMDMAGSVGGRPRPPPQTIQMAVVVIATVPILLVYPFLQKYFTRGVLTGAIKG